jgi:hypothetical protein
LVRTIASSVRFHSITAFGGGAGAPAMLGGGVGDGAGGLVPAGDCAAPEGGAATAAARAAASAGRRASLRFVIACLSCLGLEAHYDVSSSYAASYTAY